MSISDHFLNRLSIASNNKSFATHGFKYTPTKDKGVGKVDMDSANLVNREDAREIYGQGLEP